MEKTCKKLKKGTAFELPALRGSAKSFQELLDGGTESTGESETRMPTPILIPSSCCVTYLGRVKDVKTTKLLETTQNIYFNKAV